MRRLGAVLLLLITSLLVMTAPTLAQSTLRACGVELTAPADGAVLDPGYRTNFTWGSEPRGTASREWVSVRVDGSGEVSFDDATHAKADARLYKGFARGRPGVYAWAVIFSDANGNPICISQPRTYVVLGNGFASLSESVDGQVIAAAKAALGRYVIVLTGGGSTTYGGSAPVDRYVASNNYNDVTDADNWKAKGYTGLEIWGNANNNKIKGSDLSDLIYGGNESCASGPVLDKCYAGDEIDGRGGDDKIVGGNESCGTGVAFTKCEAGDKIYGGDGKDEIVGGNESCGAGFFLSSCNAGDDLHGGAGDDTITGGDESCIAIGIASCHAGDNIYGDAGKDTALGGTGDDEIHGGNDADELHGGAGDDEIFGENGDDKMFGDSGSDEITGGQGNDVGVGGTGQDNCSNNTESQTSC